VSMKVQAELHRLERRILPLISVKSDVRDLIKTTSLSEVEVVRAVQWLRNKGLVEVREQLFEIVVLDKNGVEYSKHGMPEGRFLEAVKNGNLAVADIVKKTGLSNEEVNVSLGIVRRNNWVKVNGKNPMRVSLTVSGQKKIGQGFAADALLKKTYPHAVASLSKDELEELKYLRKRRGIFRDQIKRTIKVKLTKAGETAAADPSIGQEVVDRLTPEMIKARKFSKLRAYDVTGPVPRIFYGKKQVYRRFLEHVRDQFMALGFEEMSGPIIESEFWNMDALYMPQFHSARDIHDAYYVKNPKYSKNLPSELVGRVKHAHEKGVDGSRGWGYKFDEKKTARLILRTHDTAISPRVLSSRDLKIPGKYFQIARCFRYDVIDATHNADFDQIGGFVVDKNLNLRNLFWLLRMFAKEFCETDEIRVVPSYFPFTEPSVGLYAKHPDMGWIELAGAGIFRPEMTHPLGVKEPVIAWGIGLGRVAMFKLGVKDIRQLYSHDLEYLREAKVV